MESHISNGVCHIPVAITHEYESQNNYSAYRRGKALSFKGASDMAAYIAANKVELIDACFVDPLVNSCCISISNVFRECGTI